MAEIKNGNVQEVIEMIWLLILKDTVSRVKRWIEVKFWYCLLYFGNEEVLMDSTFGIIANTPLKAKKN